MEKVAKRGNRLSVVLAGHPKLRNELVNRSTLEEIAARTTVFELEGTKGHQYPDLDILRDSGDIWLVDSGITAMFLSRTG